MHGTSPDARVLSPPVCVSGADFSDVVGVFSWRVATQPESEPRRILGALKTRQLQDS
jgi:hypothetical protein